MYPKVILPLQLPLQIMTFFTHKPIIYPRKGTPKESLYLKAWHSFCDKPIYESSDVTTFNQLFPAWQFDQKRASEVAASFMVFMGCNAGESFTIESEKLFSSTMEMNKSNCFMAVWAIENKRSLGINDNIRYVEAILTPREVFEHRGLRNDYISKNITWVDYEIIETMVQWWASYDASHLREKVSKEFKALKNKAAVEGFNHLQHYQYKSKATVT